MPGMMFARWALSVSALGVIGAFGATLLNYPADPRVIRVGRWSAAGLVVSAWLIITAQLYSWFGIDGFKDPTNVWTMLSITLWGLHWVWLASAAVAIVVIFAIAAARPRLWIYASGAAAAAVAMTAPLIGHGGTHDVWIGVLHRAHLFGAGLWIGSLMVALAAGVKDTQRLLLSLRRFAPIAATGATLVVVSGLTLAWLHLRPLSTLWTTDYGRTLIAKSIGVLVIGGLGFVNWRGPRLRIVITEVAMAVLVVLSLTALLSGLEMPGH